MFLFVLVGATVNIGYIGKVGIKALIVIAGALVVRNVGVLVCLLGTGLEKAKDVYHAGVHTESDSSGGNRWNPAGAGICVWRIRSAAVLRFLHHRVHGSSNMPLIVPIKSF